MQKLTYVPINLAGAKMPEAMAAAAILLTGKTDVTMRTLSNLELMKHTFEVANA